MKTAKLIIAIVALVISIVVIFQSCAVGIGNAMNANTTDTSGGGGIFLAILFIIAGIVGIVTRNSKGGNIATGIFFIIAAIVGFANLGTFGDLIIWAVLSLIFGVVFIAGAFFIPKVEKKKE